MKDEISSVSIMAVCLIALAAVIGLGFGVFEIAKGSASDGVTDLNTELMTVEQSQFSNYNQSIITGYQVKAAIQTFEGQPIAIAVSTSALQSRSPDLGDTDISELVETNSNLNVSNVISAYLDDMEPLSGYGQFDDRQMLFINYNALMSSIYDDSIDLNQLKYDATGYYIKDNFQTKGDSILFNNKLGNISKSGDIEFIDNNSKFSSNLIFNSSNEIIGIAFEQIEK